MSGGRKEEPLPRGPCGIFLDCSFPQGSFAFVRTPVSPQMLPVRFAVRANYPAHELSPAPLRLAPRRRVDLLRHVRHGSGGGTADSARTVRRQGTPPR